LHFAVRLFGFSPVIFVFPQVLASVSEPRRPLFHLGNWVPSRVSANTISLIIICVDCVNVLIEKVTFVLFKFNCTLFFFFFRDLETCLENHRTNIIILVISPFVTSQILFCFLLAKNGKENTE